MTFFQMSFLYACICRLDKIYYSAEFGRGFVRAKQRASVEITSEMFLKYLSDQDCEERYWPFVFRFETIVAGVVSEVAKRIDSLTNEQARAFFENVFAATLDERSNVAPPGWWSLVEPPPYRWFQEYLNRELPFMISEAKRQSCELKETLAETGKDNSFDVFDRSKIHRCSHASPSFRDFLRHN